MVQIYYTFYAVKISFNKFYNRVQIWVILIDAIFIYLLCKRRHSNQQIKLEGQAQYPLNQKVIFVNL